MEQLAWNSWHGTAGIEQLLRNRWQETAVTEHRHGTAVRASLVDWLSVEIPGQVGGLVS